MPKNISSKNQNCPSCNSTNTKRNGTDNGVQRYFCKDCDRSFSDSDRTVGRPKRADGLTRQQAWYQRNRDRMNEVQRDRRAKKKESDST